MKKLLKKKGLIFLFSFFGIAFLSLFFVQLSFGKGNYILFYSYGCPHCAKVRHFIETNNVEKVISIEEKEVSRKSNFEEFLEALNVCKIPVREARVPLLFDGRNCILGDKPIIKFLKTKVSERKNSLSGRLQKYSKEKTTSLSLSLPVVFIAALADSVNPCAFAVLILLLSTILISKKRKQVILAGFSFILAVYISYLVMGLTGWHFLSQSNLTFWFVKGAGILAIFLAILNFKDCLSYGKFGFVMEVPFSWRPKMKNLIASIKTKTHSYLNLGIIVGSFLIGLVISLFLLPCTSGPYVVILGLLSKENSFYLALRYLIFYNLVFVLPMVFITLLVAFGLNPDKLEKIREKHIKTFHLIIALILLGLGVYILIFF